MACRDVESAGAVGAVAQDQLGNFPDEEDMFALKQPVRCRFIRL